MVSEYALYKGEEILAIGTIDELSKKFNIKRDTLFFYGTPSYRKRAKEKGYKNHRILIKLEE